MKDQWYLHKLMNQWPYIISRCRRTAITKFTAGEYKILRKLISVMGQRQELWNLCSSGVVNERWLCHYLTAELASLNARLKKCKNRSHASNWDKLLTDRGDSYGLYNGGSFIDNGSGIQLFISILYRLFCTSLFPILTI